jgi:hypothetical protein
MNPTEEIKRLEAKEARIITWQGQLEMILFNTRQNIIKYTNWSVEFDKLHALIKDIGVTHQELCGETLPDHLDAIRIKIINQYAANGGGLSLSTIKVFFKYGKI